MKFIIEPINDTDCRIVDIDCSGLQGQAVDELTIPATVEQDGKTYAVKEVGNGVCHTNKLDENTAKYAAFRRLKKIIFSEGIEAIGGVMGTYGSNADERGNSDTLTEVVLPSTLKVIGAGAFMKCKELSSINIPDGVEVIGARAFMSCKELSSINIPDGVEVIGEYAFAGCGSLSLFQWPKSLKKVNLSAFSDLQAPKDEDGHATFVLTIPDSIEAIEGILSWGAYMKECIVSEKVWDVFDGSKLPGIIFEINVPEGAKKIKGHYSCIQKISLPDTIEEIGDEAFEGSHALDCLTALPSALKIVGKKAFYGAYNATDEKELRLPSSLVSVDEDAFGRWRTDTAIRLIGDDATMKLLMGQPGALNGTLVEAIDIPEGATEVNVCDCPELERLTIPSTVTKITEISKCPKLKSLIIPDSVTLIEKISNCESLETLRLSSNLEQLKELSDCPKIEELHLPDSLKKLKENPSGWGCQLSHLSARIDASVDVWKLICTNTSALLHYAPASGELVIPEGVESLANSLLTASKFTTLRLPSTLKEIGKYTLKGCKNLKSLTIPSGVKVLSKEVLSECSSLESVEFAEGSLLEKIESEAFNKTGLKSLVLPVGCKTLGGEVFKDCAELESVSFPASMTDFGFSANNWGETTTPFVRCKNLKYVVFLANDPATAVYPAALGKLCDWYVPDNMVDHVKAFIEKAKSDYPKVKGIGAKKVLPLSKLKGDVSAVAPKKKAAAKKDNLTQSIQMHSLLGYIVYRFAIEPEDMAMLDNTLDRNILAARYMRDKISECSMKIVFQRGWGEELSLDTKVNSATEKQWHSTPKTIVKVDYSDKSSLPEDFPTHLADGLAQYGTFNKFLAAKLPNYDKPLPADAPAYLEVKLDVKLTYDFRIGEKEKFNVKKITVLPLWDDEYEHFAFMYNGRYIPLTSLGNVERYSNYSAFEVYDDIDFKEKIEIKDAENEGFSISTDGYINPSLPLVNDILLLLK